MFTGLALGRSLPGARCSCRLALLPGARSAWGAGISLPGCSPSLARRGEHWPLPRERSLTPCLHPTQVPWRRVHAWSSWWTCGTPTWPPRSAKPLTLSSPQDDDGAARCRGFEGSWRAGGRPCRLGSAVGPAPHADACRTGSFLPAHGLGVLPPGALVNGNCDVYQRPSLSFHCWLQGLFSNMTAHRLPSVVSCSTTLVRVMLLLCFAVFRSRVTKPRVFV